MIRFRWNLWTNIDMSSQNHHLWWSGVTSVKTFYDLPEKKRVWRLNKWYEYQEKENILKVRWACYHRVTGGEMLKMESKVCFQQQAKMTKGVRSTKEEEETTGLGQTQSDSFGESLFISCLKIDPKLRNFQVGKAFFIFQWILNIFDGSMKCVEINWKNVTLINACGGSMTTQDHLLSFCLQWINPVSHQKPFIISAWKEDFLALTAVKP